MRMLQCMAYCRNMETQLLYKSVLSNKDDQVVTGDPRDVYPDWVINKCLTMGDSTFSLAKKFLKQVDHMPCLFFLEATSA